MNTIFLSADGIFHTIEGEGISIGKPAVFMRLAMCNLTCKGWATPENPNGCDTADSWRVKRKFSFAELATELLIGGFAEKIARGDLWKITGGEPMLQQKALLEFLQTILIRFPGNLTEHLEIETNATVVPLPGWNEFAPMFVCSPKLENNGDPEEKRYNRAALEWHAANAAERRRSVFKFVITGDAERDLKEIRSKYVDLLGIPPGSVWLMPECATREQQNERAPRVAEICKAAGFNFSPRLQILIWNQTTGV